MNGHTDKDVHGELKMNIHLYKVLAFDTDDEPTGFDCVDRVRVMTLDDLRREFLWAYHSGYIPMELTLDYARSNDYRKEDWEDIGSLSAGTMIDMLNDVCNYSSTYWYIITETDLTIKD